MSFYRILLDSMKIKQTLFIVISVFLLSVVTVFAVSETSYAQAPKTCGGKTLKDGENCCDGVVTSILSCDDGSGSSLEDTGLWSLLLLVINILTAGVGVTAVGGVIYGAVLYTTSGGSVDQVKKARGIFMNVIIGLLMYTLMYAFLNYIVPGGMFN